MNGIGCEIRVVLPVNLAQLQDVVDRIAKFAFDAGLVDSVDDVAVNWGVGHVAFVIGEVTL